MKNKNNGSKSLTFMLWLYFIILAVTIFVLLWFMQVVLLQTYYSTMKKTETAQIGSEVENVFKNALDYKDQIDKTAYKNSASIYIFNMQGDLFYTNTSYGGQNYFNQSQTGTLAQMPGRNVSIDISDIVTKISESQSKKVAYTLEIDRLKSQVYVYGKTIPDTDYCYVILMPIDPIDATSSVITSQLIYITIISLIISTVISLFMSRKISKPIKLMNDAAKKLGKGDYSVVFEKCGCEELDELADTLNKATTSLGRTDEIKRELIANVSHDLKTPLTMIKAYSEMIRDLSGDNKVKREEHLKVIIDETDRLTRLVNDMMDLSKIESGIMTINKEIFNFTELASSLIDRIKYPLLDYLKNVRPNDTDLDYIFITTSKPYRHHIELRTHNYIVKKYLIKAGIDINGRKHGFHSLRHSFSTSLLNQDISLYSISSILGHQDIKTTMTYLDINTSKLKELALEVPYVK